MCIFASVKEITQSLRWLFQTQVTLHHDQYSIGIAFAQTRTVGLTHNLSLSLHDLIVGAIHPQGLSEVDRAMRLILQLGPWLTPLF